MAKLPTHNKRRLALVLLVLAGLGIWLVSNPASYQPIPAAAENPTTAHEFLATTILEQLAVAEPYTDTKYIRTDFYKSWATYNGCDMRNVILQRDLVSTTLNGCVVESGTLNDPYTGTTINFTRGQGTSSAIQIDHVVALSNAWRTGAHRLDQTARHDLSQDPLNLLAVDGPANQQKSDQDASQWLPPNVIFQCQYVARQISVKHKYVLWVTAAEKSAMQRVLSTCPNEPTVGLENPAP